MMKYKYPFSNHHGLEIVIVKISRQCHVVNGVKEVPHCHIFFGILANLRLLTCF